VQLEVSDRAGGGQGRAGVGPAFVLTESHALLLRRLTSVPRRDLFAPLSVETSSRRILADDYNKSEGMRVIIKC
jgi:hypothetical protein